MGDGFESFEINDFDLEHAFNPLKRRKFTKNQQIYGMWADEEEGSGSDDDGFGNRRGKKAGGSKAKDYSTPVSFVSGGVKQGDKVKSKFNDDDVKEEDDEDDGDLPIEIKSFSKKSHHSKRSTKPKGNVIRNEVFAGIRGGSAPTGEAFGDWEKYTKGIGSKLLSKMGHKQGTGLGREGKGIAEPIQAAVRPGRGAVGIYGPEVKGPKMAKDLKRDKKSGGLDSGDESDEENDTSETRPVYQKGQWKKEANRQRPKPRYKTWDELVKDNSSKRSENQSSIKIIDMTGKEQKVYTGYEAFTKRTKKPQELVEEVQPEVRQNFDVPELRYNLDLLVDMTEEQIIKNDRQLRFLKDQTVALKRDEQELTEKVSFQQGESERLKSLLDVLDEFVEKSAINLVTLNDCKSLIKNLQENFYTEYKMFGLSDIAITNVLPLIKRYFSTWQPLEQPDYGLDIMNDWKNLLEETSHWASKSTDLENLDPFHRLLWEGWMPQIRRVALRWEPRNCDEMVNLIEVWIPILPTWILENILEQIILPRLQSEVEKWDPTTDTLPIHSWLHPWLPLMGDRLQPVYAPIRHKLSKALSQWHPRDPSAKMILKPWRDVFTTGTMDGFLAQNILPKLEHCMSMFEINPANQQLDSWYWIMNWLDMISPIHIANLLIKIFFPKWHEALFTWLNCRPNYSEISQWYTGWKSLFSEDLMSFQTVKEQFNQALEMMNRAVSGLPLSTPAAFLQQTSSVPEHVHQRNLDFLASRAPGPSAPANFKDLLDKKAEEHNILFVPLPNKYREGKPVYRFGSCQIYVDRNVVFMLQNNNLWTPVSVEQLINFALS